MGLAVATRFAAEGASVVAGDWNLPALQFPGAKSVRGHVGVSADAGFRLTPERTQALTEIATAFFPRKVPGIQSAFRLSDQAWQATLRVERLPQTVQADVVHLFSIAEGIAYGSSLVNYMVSGAPVSAFRVELSDEYFNVEFTGRDIRNWQKTTNGFVVQLHTPVSGSYTLLATYERPFKAQGETLAFTGARPLDAQSEQGHTLIISAYQFQVKAVDVSPGLLPLETGEVPSEYRLFFDAPILAAYRYAARPFNLKLALVCGAIFSKGKSCMGCTDFYIFTRIGD
jgi:NAD(P)-dependent dehydrogenase (short-subunit alcohol dehydrogenase family)